MQRHRSFPHTPIDFGKLYTWTTLSLCLSILNMLIIISSSSPSTSCRLESSLGQSCTWSCHFLGCQCLVVELVTEDLPDIVLQFCL